MATADPFAESSSDELTESEDEGIEDYRKGGYHAIRLGDSFKNGRYVVQRKLGWGIFSTVWLAWDVQQSRYVALKIQKSAQHFTEAALDEINILKHIAEGDPEDKKCVVKLLDHFKHTGPNGQHVCMVFEYLGDSLLFLIKYTRYKGLPFDIVRKLCYHILVGLDYLHRELSIIHTDLKPENVLLYSRVDPSKDPRNSKDPPLLAPPLDRPSVLMSCSSRKGSVSGVLSKSQRKKLKRKARRATNRLVSSVAGGEIGGPQSKKILQRQETYVSRITTLKSMDLRCKIVDVGNACWSDKKITSIIQTRQYRAPEIILGASYSTSVDIWSFGCIAFELATGDVLFEIQGSEGFAEDEDHLAMMMELLGKIPRKVALGGNNSRDFFDRYGDLKHIRRLRFRSLDRLLVEKYRINEKDANEFANFISPMLDFAPEKRPTAEQCLCHPWIKCETNSDPPSMTSNTGKSFMSSIRGNPDKQRMQNKESERDILETAELHNKKIVTKAEESGLFKKSEKAEITINKLTIDENRSGFGKHWEKARVGIQKTSSDETRSEENRSLEKAEVCIKKLAKNGGQSGLSGELEKSEEGIAKTSYGRPRMFVSDIHLRASKILK